MAIITAILGLFGRFAGKVLTTTLGWASVLLFGRIPEDRQIRFSLLTFGSLVWVVTVVGTVFPDAGVVLFSLVPLPDWVDRGVVRLVMLVAALALPAVLGAVAISVADPRDRPKGTGMIVGVLRGYLLTPILAVTLAILAVAGVVRKARTVMARRESGHIPIVVRPGRYEALVDRLEGVLRDSKLVDGRHEGSAILTRPARLLASVSGTGLRSLVPDRLLVLTGPNLELEVYPSDLANSADKLQLARTRAAIMENLDSTDCWFTTTRETQAIEDQLAKLDAEPGSWDPKVIEAIDHRLATEAIDDDEWDVLYRRRLQVAAEATGTNLQQPAAGKGGESPEAPDGAMRERQPDLGAVVGLVTAGLVMADIAVLASRQRNGRH
jgi:hypothetical protein